jgi:transcription termination/antitermination protein NusG
MESFWYLVKVLPGKERQLEQQFNEEISLGRIPDIKTFVCPVEKQLKVVNKKKVVRDKVIYTGYLYFESNERLDVDQLKNLSHLPGIMGILGDRTPVLIRDVEMKKVLKSENEEVLKNDTIYRKGELIKITDGPFKTFEGHISEIRDEKIDVEVTIFGRVTNVNLDIFQIEKYV